jgi:hypothetical protein
MVSYGGPLPIPISIKSTPSLIGDISFPCKSAVLNLVASRVKDRLLIEKNEEETLLEILKHLTVVTANDMIANAVICIFCTEASIKNSARVGCDLQRRLQITDYNQLSQSANLNSTLSIKNYEASK